MNVWLARETPNVDYGSSWQPGREVKEVLRRLEKKSKLPCRLVFMKILKASEPGEDRRRGA